MHVIIGQSTSWSVMGISDIVIYVKKAFVHIFMLKMFCLPIEEESQQLFMGWGRYLDFHKHLKYYILKTKVPEHCADDCINLKDGEPIVLLGIVNKPIYFMTSFVTLPEKWQGANFLKILPFYQECFLFG